MFDTLEKGDIVTLDGKMVKVTDVADGWVEGFEDKRETAFVYTDDLSGEDTRLFVSDRSLITYNQTASQRQTATVLDRLKKSA